MFSIGDWKASICEYFSRQRAPYLRRNIGGYID